MIRLDKAELKLLNDVGRQYPRFVEILSRWRTEELERLPYTNKDNVDVMRGRVQALTEMQRAILGHVEYP